MSCRSRTSACLPRPAIDRTRRTSRRCRSCTLRDRLRSSSRTAALGERRRGGFRLEEDASLLSLPREVGGREDLRYEHDQPIGLAATKPFEMRRIEIEDRAKLAPGDDGHDELRSRAIVTRDVSRKCGDVGHELHLLRSRACATDAAREVDAKAAHRSLIGTDGELAR